MVLHATVRVLATRSGARISALLGDAGLVRWTVRIDDALRATVGRKTYVVLQAGTCGLVANCSALCVQTARTRVARIAYGRHWGD